MKKIKILKIAVFVIGFMVLASAVVMWLWNHLIPELFHGPYLTFFQSAGLIILVKLLFGFGGKHRHFMGRYQMENLKKHFENMSPEERDRMRKLWKKRCSGFDCSDIDESTEKNKDQTE